MSDLRTLYLDFLRRDPRSPVGSLLLFLLKLFSLLYLAGWWLHRVWRQRGPFRKRRLPCPVVSVGNLSVGGTGKTPLVIHLAKILTGKGLRVVVLSRGYGRKGNEPLVQVSDGKRTLVEPERGGDEPVLIARSVLKAAVWVGKDRFRAGMEACRTFRPDVILLDDGFQRRFELHRDLDIVVLDGTDPFSTRWTLPAGKLREPLSTLTEADVLVVHKLDLARHPEGILAKLKALHPGALLLGSRYRPLRLVDHRTGKVLGAAALSKKPFGALAGLGDPVSFLRTLGALKLNARHAYRLPDHFAYTRENLADILRDAQGRGLKALVTTRKDAVKIPKDLGFPLLVLEVGWEVVQGRKDWEGLLRRILSLARKGRT